MTKSIVGDREMTISLDPSMNAPGITFSEYVHKNYDSLFNDQNPEMARPLYNQDMAIFWPTFADWSITHPKFIGTIFISYAQTMGRDILGILNITRTQTNHVIKSILKVDKFMAPLSTRKTAPQIISTKVTNVDATLQLRAQGFSVDMYHMKTPDGRKNYDAHMNQLFSNFVATIKLSSITTLENTPSFYRRPHQLYAWAKRAPNSPEEVYEFDQIGFCPLSKQSLGFESLAMQVNAIMGRENESFSRLVLTRDDEFLIKSNDAGRLFVPFAGPSSIANRQAGGPSSGKVNSSGSGLVGIEFIVIPMLDTSMHNDSDNRIFTTRIHTGSKWSFWDETRDVPAHEFVSCMRDTQVASWKTNEMDVYRLDIAFSKCPQFYQIQGHWSGNATTPHDRFRDEYCGSVLSNEGHDARMGGRINRNWLHLLAVRAPIEFARRRTIMQGNEEKLDVLLSYNHTIVPSDPNVGVKGGVASAKSLRQRGGAGGGGSGNVKDVVTRWTPVNMIMEISEQLTATKYLRLCYATMAHAIFKDVSNAEMHAFCEGMKWVDECSKLPVLLDGFSTFFGLALDRLQIANIAPRSNRKTSKFENDANNNGLLVPNKYGGLDLVGMNVSSLPGYGYSQAGAQGGTNTPPPRSKKPNDSILHLPGFGNISGIYTLNEALGKSPKFASYFADELKSLLEKFIVVFEKIHRNILECVYCNVAVDPRLIPLAHDSPDMSDMMRSRIVTWYNVFSTYGAPLYMETGQKMTREDVVRQSLSYDKGKGYVNLGTSAHDSNAAIKNKRILSGLTVDSVRTMLSNAGFESDVYVGAFANILGVCKIFFAKNNIKSMKETDLVEALKRMGPELKVDQIKYILQNFSTFILISNVVCSFPSITSVIDAFNLVQTATEIEKTPIIVLPLTSSFNDYGSKIDVTAKIPNPWLFITTTGQKTTSERTEMPLHHVFMQTYYVENLQIDAAGQESNFKDEDSMWLNFGTFMTSNAITTGPDTNMAGHGTGVTVSDTLMGAGPYIDPMLPSQSRLVNVRRETLHKILKRSTDISRSWVASIGNADTHFFQYTNMYPAAAQSLNYESYLANKFYEDNLYKESAFEKLKAAFPNLPEAFLHNVIYPLSGNPAAIKNASGQIMTNMASDVPDSQIRYMATHSYAPKEAIAARLVLFQEPCAQMACVWREKNIRIPFDVTVLRPREELETHAMGAVSDGYIGSTYISDMLTLLDFSANTKHYHFQAEMQEGSLITEIEKFYMIPHVRGGRLIGGKGNDWYYNKFPLPSHEAFMDSVKMNEFREGSNSGESMGNNSNFAVLQGYNHAFNRKELSVYTDICGYSDVGDFVGRLNACREFDSDQPEPMMEGLFFHNMVMDWERLKFSRPNIPYEHQSFRNVADTRRINFHCLQTTQRVYCKTLGYCDIKSAHLFGEQTAGLRARESGNARVGYVDC